MTRDPEYWRAWVRAGEREAVDLAIEAANPVDPLWRGLPARGGWLGPPPPCDGSRGHRRMYGSDTCESTRGEI
jgi:hypothetical protein